MEWKRRGGHEKREKLYQHAEGGRMANPANWVAQQVREEGELPTGSNLTPPLHFLHSPAILFRVELPHHYHHPAPSATATATLLSHTLSKTHKQNSKPHSSPTADE